ncbi:hypothetical protein GEMRC1_009933 [Eukaryota sp. GEM-RC1]
MMEHITETTTSPYQQGCPPRSPCNSKIDREPAVSTLRPGHEEYELPSEAPFTAKLVNVAYNATEDDIQRVFSSLPIKVVQSPFNMPGIFFVEFLDVQGLKQCLDQYWMFDINGSPIRTYVASAPQSSVEPLNTSTFSDKPNAEPKPLELLPLTSSLHSRSRYIQFQQSLVVLIHLRLLRFLCKSSLDVRTSHYLFRSRKIIPTFLKKVGYVSHHFFESALLATKVFFQTNTFSVVPKELPQLCSFASFFGAEVQSVFLYADGTSIVEEFLNYSNVISGLELKLENHSDLEFLSKSSLFFPRLKQLHVGVPSSISMAFIELLKVNNTVTRVNLWDSAIGDEGVEALAEVLKVNSTISDIFLWNNSIGDEGVRALTDALKINNTVTSIDLGYNSIGNEEAKALADALKVNTTVTRVVLDFNSVGAEGARALADALIVNGTITNVDLQNNSIGAEGARALADALKVNNTITSVYLQNNSIGTEGARALADALIVNTTITNVDLQNNSIGAEGARALADALIVNGTVTNIDLRSNSIGDEGARSFGEALKVNATLTSINLEYNSIGIE